MKTLIILMFLAVGGTSVFAQKEKATKQKIEQTTASPQYTCPMHHDIISNGAGTCTKCGKQLVVIDRVSSKQGRIVYTCSMHPDAIGNEAGKCPVCGMALEAKKGNTDHSK